MNLGTCRLGKRGFPQHTHCTRLTNSLTSGSQHTVVNCRGTVPLLACLVKGLNRCLHGCQATTFHQRRITIQNEREHSTVGLCSSTLLGPYHKRDAVEVLGSIQDTGPSPHPGWEGSKGTVRSSARTPALARTSGLTGSIPPQLPTELQHQGAAPNFSAIVTIID